MCEDEREKKVIIRTVFIQDASVIMSLLLYLCSTGLSSIFLVLLYVLTAPVVVGVSEGDTVRSKVTIAPSLSVTRHEHNQSGEVTFYGIPLSNWLEMWLTCYSCLKLL